MTLGLWWMHQVPELNSMPVRLVVNEETVRYGKVLNFGEVPSLLANSWPTLAPVNCSFCLFVFVHLFLDLLELYRILMED